MITEPKILLKNISVFQKSKLILNNIDLSINSGEFVYLIGKTGSGKTSLLQTIYADLSVTSGVARV